MSNLLKSMEHEKAITSIQRRELYQYLITSKALVSMATWFSSKMTYSDGWDIVVDNLDLARKMAIENEDANMLIGIGMEKFRMMTTIFTLKGK